MLKFGRPLLHSRGSVTAAIGLLLAMHLSAQTNPFIGSWRLNVKQSKFDGQPPRDYVSIRTYDERDGLMLHTIVYTYTKGSGFVFSALKYDGKEYPVFTQATLGSFLSGGTKPPVTLSITRIDAGSFKYTDHRAGRVTATGTCTVSTDGRTLTEEVTNFDPQGKETFHTLSVYDKQ
jgi:hypothetical protein